MERLETPDALLSPAQVAELVGVQPATVRRWCREGHLPALRIGHAPNGPLRVGVATSPDNSHSPDQENHDD
jgi:excisionase family DNA binding protein